MNEVSYASLEASKRLVDAGIVLETEAVWHLSGDNETYFLETRGSSPSLLIRWGDFPAPCMAEVWRELPERSYFTKYNGHYQAWSEWTTFVGHGNSSPVKENTNPADALIDLLIWTRKEANHADR